MAKKMFLALLMVLLVSSTAGLSAAPGKGNPRKGKYLFRKTCRVCHKEGASGKMAGKPLNPIDKTQAEWTKVFEKIDKLACKEQWGKLSERDLKDIFAHLHGHASDSPNPARCR